MTGTTWLEIAPVDTLFFRGAESMEAGENHEVDTMFPPMPTTITGAIRTAILRQKGIHPADYLARLGEYCKRYPLLGEPEEAGFSVLGPLFKIAGEILLPVPAHWYAVLPGPREIRWGEKYPVQAARPLAVGSLGLRGSVGHPFWVHNPAGRDMKNLAGYWATPQTFTTVGQECNNIVFHNDPANLTAGTAAIFPATVLYVREERVGVALTSQRTARAGHLYSTVHIRLQDGVSILAGIMSLHAMLLDNEGLLQLGGEQRMCRYRFLAGIKLPESAEKSMVMALSPIKISELSPDLAECPRASGRLLRMGGWDMAKGFHKKMCAWLPAGTVFKAGDGMKAPPSCINI